MPMQDIVYQFGTYRFSPNARELWLGDQRVRLPRRSFECLACLLAHRDRAVSRDELVEAIFRRSNVSDAQLGQVVLRTRRAIGDDGQQQRVIRTIPGHGYRWIAALEVTPGTRQRTSTRGDDIAHREADVTQRKSLIARLFKRHRHRWYSMAAAICILAVALGTLVWAVLVDHSTQSPAEQRTIEARIVVLPIVVDGLQEDSWVRLGAMDVVGSRLRAAGLAVIPSENVVALLHASDEPVHSSRTDLAQEIGDAAIVVRGKAVHRASGWTVHLRKVPETGIPVHATFTSDTAVAAARGATDLLLAALGHPPPPTGEGDVRREETLQRARAAMLANELETARAILSNSPELETAPAERAYWLAMVDFRAGRLDAVEDALNTLLEHPTTAADQDLRARVLTARGATRVRRGEFAQGGDDFSAALRLLDQGADELLRGRARLGLANSLVAARRYDAATNAFSTARVELERAGDLLGVARVDANLGMLELERGRPAVALTFLSAAAERFRHFGALHEYLLTLTGLMHAQLAMLDLEAAQATVAQGWAVRERVTDPDQRVDLMMNRAEVFLHSGRYTEAGQALQYATALPTSGNLVLLARRGALRSSLALRQGRLEHAADIAAAALRDWPESGADGDRAAVILTRQRALLADGAHQVAFALLDRARSPPDTIDAAPGAVADAVAMAESFAHDSQHERAIDWYEYAWASAERQGVPGELLAVASSWAPRLLEHGQIKKAAAQIGRVAPWADVSFDAALLQVRLYQVIGPRETWYRSLVRAQALAGERSIEEPLTVPPKVGNTRLPE